MSAKLFVDGFEQKGIWWLPARPDVRIYGTLRYHVTDGITLGLFGALRDDGAPFPLEVDFILGELPDGKPLTLLGCYENKLNISAYALSASTGFAQTNFRANYIFEGKHFLDEADVTFHKLTFGLSHLRNWSDAGQISTAPADREITLRYERPDDIVLALPGIGTLTIYYALDLSQSFGGATLGKEVGITVETAEPRPFREWLQTVYLLRAFFSFASGQPVQALHMSQTEAVTVETPSGTTYDTFLRTNILFRVPTFPDESTTEGGRNMLFVLSDIKEDLETCLQNWFQKAETLAPVYDLYFGTLLGASMFPIHRYSSYAQALETYHRRTSNRSALPKPEFKTMVGDILDAVSECHRAWLKDKLSFSNELSLRQRLEEIMQTYGQIFGSLPNEADFIKKTVDTRNYLTHYDRSSKHKAAQDHELHLLSQSLKMLVEMCLLKELGLADERIRKIVLRRRQSEHWFAHPVQPEVNDAKHGEGL